MSRALHAVALLLAPAAAPSGLGPSAAGLVAIAAVLGTSAGVVWLRRRARTRASERRVDAAVLSAPNAARRAGLARARQRFASDRARFLRSERQELSDFTSVTARAELVARLERIGAQSLPRLCAFSLSDSRPVAEAACEVLSGRSEPEARNALFRVVASDLPWGRCLAVRSVAGFPDERVLGTIQALLEDDEAGVRSAAAEAAGVAGVKDAAEALAAATGDPDVYVRRSAGLALARLGDGRGVAALASMLDVGSPNERRWAATDLAHVSDPAAVLALRSALDDEDSHVAFAAAASLASCGDEVGTSWLYERLGSGDRLAVLQAGRSLDAALPGWQGSARARAILPVLLRAWARREVEHDGVLAEPLDRIDPDWRRSDEARALVPELLARIKCGDVVTAARSLLDFGYVPPPEELDDLLAQALAKAPRLSPALCELAERSDPQWASRPIVRADVRGLVDRVTDPLDTGAFSVVHLLNPIWKTWGRDVIESVLEEMPIHWIESANALRDSVTPEPVTYETSPELRHANDMALRREHSEEGLRLLEEIAARSAGCSDPVVLVAQAQAHWGWPTERPLAVLLDALPRAGRKSNIADSIGSLYLGYYRRLEPSVQWYVTSVSAQRDEPRYWAPPLYLSGIYRRYGMDAEAVQLSAEADRIRGNPVHLDADWFRKLDALMKRVYEPRIRAVLRRAWNAVLCPALENRALDRRGSRP